jgi:hypothetical protein
MKKEGDRRTIVIQAACGPDAPMRCFVRETLFASQLPIEQQIPNNIAILDDSDDDNLIWGSPNSGG